MVIGRIVEEKICKIALNKIEITFQSFDNFPSLTQRLLALVTYRVQMEGLNFQTWKHASFMFSHELFNFGFKFSYNVTF